MRIVFVRLCRVPFDCRVCTRSLRTQLESQDVLRLELLRVVNILLVHIRQGVLSYKTLVSLVPNIRAVVPCYVLGLPPSSARCAALIRLLR